MIRKAPLFAALLAATTMFGLTGCQSRYVANRVSDFGDIIQIGGGLTTENPKTGIVPPSLGVYVQATEFINLGAMHFTGISAEWDGRGAFAGRESRTRLGFGPWQRLMIDQNYVDGCENYFKKYDTLWNDRMGSPDMTWWGKPAKQLSNDDWAISLREDCPAMHRGWQYWENFNVELSISEPFLTHFGFNARLGFDPSEISDFLLGWFVLDYKHDDMNKEEHDEMVGPRDISQKYKPASDYQE